MSTPSSSKRFSMAIVGVVLLLSSGYAVLGFSQLRTGATSILSVAVSTLVAVVCVALLLQLAKMHAATREHEKRAVKEEDDKRQRLTVMLNEMGAKSSHKPLPFKHLGGSGLTLGTDSQLMLASSTEQIVLIDLATLVQITIPTSELLAIEISGPGTQTTSAGVQGGGFGVEGFLKGVLTAAAINALTTKSTTNTFLRLLGRSVEVYLHTSAIDTSALRIQLSPAIVRVESNKLPTAARAPDDLSGEIEKLHKLLGAGALTPEEFAAAKHKLLFSAPNALS